MHVSALNVFPVKGARGIARDRADISPAGLAGDRRWMLVDATGRFVSQRELARLALLEAVPDADGDLHLAFPDGGERVVPEPAGEERLSVRVWDDTVDAAVAGEADNAALSRWLGQDVRLVRFDAASRRSVSRDWVDDERPVGFADGFPLLVANEASLRELNRAIVAGGAEAVPMSRFRPNLVVSGAEPFAEDEWRTIRVGDAVLDLVKPCARCIVTTIDQQTGTPDGPEPIAALSRFRMSGDKRAPGVLFGWNAVPRAGGTVKVGDAAEVVARRPAGWPLKVRKAA